MFTGIVAAVGEIVKIEVFEKDRRVWISSPVLEDCALGGSVAVDGVCLTVIDRDGEVCGFDVSSESLERSALAIKEAGDRVNLERPLRAGDELGGHMVQGHVDDVGKVQEVTPEGQGRRLVVSASPSVLRYIVEKGSVTLDGVSLTVTAVRNGSFDVALVPHTLEVTTLGDAGPGRALNIEVDVLAKYVEKIASVRDEAS
jgi:riboflavin synthase